MILSNKTIEENINFGKLILPNNEVDKSRIIKAIGPASIDCRIGNVFKVPLPNNSKYVFERARNNIIDIDKVIEYEKIEVEEYIIGPNSFVLATTKEYLKLPDNISAYVEGRSSIGRAGLFVQNAGYIDPGFEGNITLELFNANIYPLKIYAGRRMCQIVFFELDQKCNKPYSGKYKGQINTTESKIHLDEN